MKISLLILSLLFSLPLCAQQTLTMKQVAPGIYVHFGKHQLPDKHNHGAIANIGFIVGDRCVAVVDSGGNPQQGEALKQAVRQTTDKPVCYVINTHVHPDHIYGNKAFKDGNTHFVGHHKLERAMAARGQYYIDKAADQLDIELTADNLVSPDMPVKKHMTINLGDRELILTAHPTAHTDNDLSVYDKKTDTLWLADLLFIEHLPVIDGSLKGWLAVLDRLENQQYHFVIPGHGPLVTDWPKAMQPQKIYLTGLLNEIRGMIAQGRFLEEAVKTVGLPDRQNWKLFDEFHRKNVTTAFAELEWED